MIYIHPATPTTASLSSTTSTRTNVFSSQDSTCKWLQGKFRERWTISALSLMLLMLNLWKAPIIILITIAGSPTFAVSVATVSVVENPQIEGDISKFNAHHNLPQQHHPNKLAVNTNQEINGNANVGLISLSFGGLVFTNNYEQKPQIDLNSAPIKKAAVVKRSGGETRVTSNQDVTTLALAMENSSSVAIANINSSWNNVYVSIGTPTTNPFVYHANPYANRSLRI